MQKIILVAHNIRSCHNVGSLLRTADGLGIEKVYLSGYTPYPLQKNDKRLPHLAAKIERQISKTALGAEKSVRWEHALSINTLLDKLSSQGYELVALEQHKSSVALENFLPANKIALIVGPEVQGLDPPVLAQADKIVEITMRGKKESFNVAVAAAMALYHLTDRHKRHRALK